MGTIPLSRENATALARYSRAVSAGVATLLYLVGQVGADADAKRV